MEIKEANVIRIADVDVYEIENVAFEMSSDCSDCLDCDVATELN